MRLLQKAPLGIVQDISVRRTLGFALAANGGFDGPDRSIRETLCAATQQEDGPLGGAAT